MIRLLAGDCREMLATLEPNSVQTCVTSPPYWSLRAYGTDPQVWASGWRGELGNEPTPELFVAHMVEVFRAVWRVLRKDGTLWLNLGFSYAGSGKGPSNSLQSEASQIGAPNWSRSTLNGGHGLYSDDEKVVNQRRAPTTPGYKPKDLIPIPFLVAMALQREGWYWRSIIAWAKKAPMPESVTDRPTSAWEPVLLMSKARTYFYDADAVREPEVSDHPSGNGYARPEQISRGGQGQANRWVPTGAGCNMRNVWYLGPEPFPDAHFATFPTEVPRRCILAGTSEKGQCPQCGAPWERVIEASKYEPPVVAVGVRNVDLSRGDKVRKLSGADYNEQVSRQTAGWRPTCGHADLEPVPQTVLDIFAGAGTTLLVADRLNRHGIGIELKPDYAEMGYERIVGDAPMFVEVVR